MKVLLFFGLLFLGIGTVHAQADCPPGTIPYGSGRDLSNCGPDNSQQNQPAQPAQPQPPLQRWQDHWGAIATYVPNGSLGAVNDLESASQAEQAALADCRSKSGTACKIEISYRNQCAAMIVGHPGYSIALGATVAEAIQKGMKMCTDAGDSNCHVYYSACSLPIRIQ